jgi:cysteine desulfurase
MVSKEGSDLHGKAGETRHYFDWAATSPAEAELVPACAAPFGNPSSPHSEGREARAALEEARRRCAAVLEVAPETVYFTSGGTESNCIAIHANLFRRGSGRAIASDAEHSSVRENIAILERLGKQTGKIAVDGAGRVTPELLAKALDKYGDVRFAAIMAVNNETGAVTDIPGLRDVLRAKDGAPVHLHCDLAQAAGKIPLYLAGWDADSASLSAHKIGGPRGIGLLYLRKPVETLCAGGGQERNMRPGTENTAGALALADCLENAVASQQARYAAARRRWKRLMEGLKTFNRAVIIPQSRAADDGGFSPYILQAAFDGIPGEVMVRALDDMGFALSTGSACSSSSQERPVLAAMGVSDKLSLEGIRISQGWTTADDEIDSLLEAIAEVLKFL